MQTLPVYFDFGLQEILTTLPFGGTLFSPGPSVRGSPERYAEYVNRHGISMIYCTPTFMEMLAGIGASLPTIKVLLLGGERLDWSLARRARKIVAGDCRVFNGYGPTEASMNCAMFPLDSAADSTLLRPGSVPIGRATGLARLAVLDRRRRPVPGGVPGELYIGGPGVASGYVNRPELTRERFMHLSTSAGIEGWVYRTGDFARALPDGNLEWLGRQDNQVKLNGYRIELDEVERRLTEVRGVRSGAVKLEKSLAGRDVLCGYVVVDGGVTADVIRRSLGRYLPAYMLPGKVHIVDRFPLTSNGKLDRTRLMPPEAAGVDQRNSIEQWFYDGIWEKDQHRINHRLDNKQRWFVYGDQTLKEFTPAKDLSFAPGPAHGQDWARLVDFIRGGTDENINLVFQVDPVLTAAESHAFLAAFSELLSLLRVTFDGTTGDRPIRLLVLTQDTYSIDGSMIRTPVNALIVGFCKALSMDCPAISWIIAGLDGGESRSLQAVLGDRADLFRCYAGGSILGYRKGERYLYRYVARDTGKLAARVDLSNQNWLVIGGFGAMAQVLTTVLSGSGARRIALLDSGKRVPADQSERSDAAEADPDNADCRLLEIEVDITDDQQFESALQLVVQEFGRLDGVIHAAGVTENASVLALTPQKVKRVLDPKVRALDRLQKVLANHAATRVILCPSIDAVRGNRNQAAYCAANAYMDAVAEHMHQRGQLWQSINWDVWGETGMAARLDVAPELRPARARTLGLGLSNLEGGQVFLHVLAGGRPRTIVSTTSLLPRIGRFKPLHFGAASDHDRSAPPGYVAAHASILQQLENIISEVLNVEQVRHDEDLLSQGVDSIAAMRIITALEGKMGVVLDIMEILSAPSLRSLAAKINGEYANLSDRCD